MTELSYAVAEIRKLEAQAPRATPGTLHVAIVMDCEGEEGHACGLAPRKDPERGAQGTCGVIAAAAEEGVTHLTLIGLPTASPEPARAGLQYLLSVLHGCLHRRAPARDQAGLRLSVIGERAALPADLAALIGALERQTRGNSGLHLTLALDHRSRGEIAAAARRLASLAGAGMMEPEDIDQAAFAAQLTTAALPDPDLMIRTGGRRQISNVLLWQLAYAEMAFVEKSWPDFTGADLKDALADFRRRQRRFGAVPADAPSTVIHP